MKTYFGFCRTFWKITKQKGFHLTLKTSELQDKILTTLVDDIKVIFYKILLYVPIFIPDAQTQILCNESIK